MKRKLIPIVLGAALLSSCGSDIDTLEKKVNTLQKENLKDGQSPIPIVSEINSNIIYEVHIEWFNYDGKWSYWILTLLIEENEDSGAEVYFTVVKTNNGFIKSAIES
ncbi:hypothetical protein MKZ08_02670 [Viridibacillus sp. FSL R5-0477]|uniref:Lipoprotein n=1 Tax=Viridibacillus arenosi FSL R5-213 TaxID=1227360 RepID=W4F7B3_9BACL|nr:MULTISPECIES: hypothetical protein [Viridibacillus]ETT88788.1 hypothetical protein C176_00315 [Viridibacillus arenosi FSL R5-213]OMC79139.1 hypothetical protein BK130_19570 [Viridibacillus sp. FSL H8-0123]OMC88318.1 hypothetical protein BK137_18785 [Viridibacillus arenosi]